MTPAPLTPPDSDLQDFPFMPLHVARLRDSDLAAEEHPEACWYALLLWSAAWHQLPAGSLPDNDAVLTKLIGLGRDTKTFAKHKKGALRGFFKCSDGRLYHPVVAEQVLESWDRKLQQRWRTECARIKKANQRNETDIATPTYADFRAGVSPARDNPSPAPVPRDIDDCPSGQWLQGTETGTETGTGTLKEEGFAFSVEQPPLPDGDGGRQLKVVPPMPKEASRDRRKPTAAEHAEFDTFWSTYPRRVAKQPALEAYTAALRAGVSAADIFAGAERYAADRQGKDSDKTAHAATWLNARRWTDEITAPPNPTGARSGAMAGYSALDQAMDGLSWDDAA